MSPKNTTSVPQIGALVNTEQRAARLERLAPSMRDGESAGRLERAAEWLAARLGLEYTDVLDDMINFLWGRPDLLSSGNTDAWLAQRAVYFVRGKAFEETRRGREVVSLDEVDPDGETLMAQAKDAEAVESLLDALVPLKGTHAPGKSQGCGVDGEGAAGLHALVAEILENADQAFHVSSGRVNVSCLSRRMGLRRETVRGRLQEIGARLCETMPGRLVATQ